jgi:hypothetical protein
MNKNEKLRTAFRSILVHIQNSFLSILQTLTLIFTTRVVGKIAGLEIYEIGLLITGH